MKPALPAGANRKPRGATPKISTACCTPSTGAKNILSVEPEDADLRNGDAERDCGR